MPTTDTGAGSVASQTGDLRFCIQQANLDATPPTIDFAIPGTGLQTIKLGSSLPKITQAVGHRRDDSGRLRGHAADRDRRIEPDGVGLGALGRGRRQHHQGPGAGRLPGYGDRADGARATSFRAATSARPMGQRRRGTATGIDVISSNNTIGGTDRGRRQRDLRETSRKGSTRPRRYRPTR